MVYQATHSVPGEDSPALSVAENILQLVGVTPSSASFKSVAKMSGARESDGSTACSLSPPGAELLLSEFREGSDLMRGISIDCRLIICLSC
jgi:hypothetical protein